MAAAIAIIGDGAMPTVCCRILSDNGCQVRLYSTFPENAAALRADGVNRRYLPDVPLPGGLLVTTDPGEALNGADLVVSAVPTQFVRTWWQGLAAAYPPGLPAVSAAKGIENETLLRPTQIIADVLDRAGKAPGPLAALSGPNIAHELVRKLPATAVAASPDAALARRIQQIFTTPYLRIYTNADMTGVEIAGATKNVIAIAAGILDGLSAGDNAKAALLTRGLVEITRLGVALGGRAETFAGLAGLGDLVTTCISPHGRNRTFGQAVGAGQSPEHALAATQSVVEGVATTRSVLQLARRHAVEMPITEAVHAILFEELSPRDAIGELMSRRPKDEREAL